MTKPRLRTKTVRTRMLCTLPPVPLFVERETVHIQDHGIISEKYAILIHVAPGTDNVVIDDIKRYDLALDMCHVMYQKLAKRKIDINEIPNSSVR